MDKELKAGDIYWTERLVYDVRMTYTGYVMDSVFFIDEWTNDEFENCEPAYRFEYSPSLGHIELYKKCMSDWSFPLYINSVRSAKMLCQVLYDEVIVPNNLSSWDREDNKHDAIHDYARMIDSTQRKSCLV